MAAVAETSPARIKDVKSRVRTNPKGTGKNRRKTASQVRDIGGYTTTDGNRSFDFAEVLIESARANDDKKFVLTKHQFRSKDYGLLVKVLRNRRLKSAMEAGLLDRGKGESAIDLRIELIEGRPRTCVVIEMNQPRSRSRSILA